MSDPEVKLKFVGSAQDAERAIATLERRLETLSQSARQMSQRSKDESKGWADSLGDVMERYVGIAATVGTVMTSVRAVVAENTKLLDQLDDFAARHSESDLKLRIQGAMTSPQVQAMLPGIEKSLMAVPSTNLDGAMKLQTQIASSGFQQRDVQSGEALKVALELKAATNQFGRDIGNEGQAVKAIGMMAKAGGSAAPSADEMRNIGGSIVSLFESSDVQFDDFKQLAPKIATLKSFGLSMEESIATFSALTDVMGGNKADTGLAQFVSRTATAGAFPERAAQLAKLGLKPEEVAMAPGGKGLVETIDLMRGKLQGMDPSERNQILAKLYGEEAGPSANFLLSDSGSATMKDYIGKASNRAGFDRNVATFSGSRFARTEREEVSDEFATLARDLGTGEYTWRERDVESARAFKQELNRTQGLLSRNFVTFGHVVEEAATYPARWAGMTPNEVGQGTPLANPGSFQNEEVVKLLTDGNRLAAENNRLLSAEKQRPINRNGQVEKD